MKNGNNINYLKFSTLSVSEETYPLHVKKVLGSKAPQNLYLMGNLSLLTKTGLGFCGSRDASEKGLEIARDCAQQAVQHDIVVISGNASGVDFEAHYNALKSGGKTIFVLPEGIAHFKIKESLKSVWDWHRALVISQFEPEATWKSFRAMTRNNLIIALSRAMIVIEAGEKGGTFHAGEETLKMKTPLYVAEHQDMSVDAKGNKILLQKGGKKLSKSRTSNRANMANIFEDVALDRRLSIQPLQTVLL